MTTDEIDELISGHFDRSLDADERAELERRLCAEPEIAHRFAAYARLHANLATVAGDEAAHRTPADTSPMPPPMPGPGAGGHRAAWAILGIAALLVIGLATAWWLPRLERPDLGAIASAHGELLVDGQPIGAGALLIPGSTLRTGIDATATLRLRDGSEVVLDRVTTLSVVRVDREWRLDLAAGEVECRVAKQAPGEGFVLATPEARVAVVGTRFLVEHRDGRSAVRVTEGEVTLAAGGELLRLGPSDRALVSAGVVTTDHPSEEVLGGEPALWREDFEQPVDSSVWIDGQRVPASEAPAGNRSGWVMAAERSEGRNGGLLKVTVKDLQAPLFTAEEDLVVRVRYWANREAGWMGVWMATEPWQAYQHFHKEFSPITDRWVTTSIRLRDVTRGEAGHKMPPGERVVHLMFQADGRPGARLYIDDISVERP